MALPKVGINVQLVPFDPPHAEAVHEWYYDVRYQAFFREFDETPLTLNDFKKFGEVMAASRNGFFVIIEKVTNKPIGLMTHACLKKKSGVYRFGILLDYEHQHKTYAIECIILHGFFLAENLGMKKYAIEFLATDKHIQRIAEQGGFIFEATLKNEAVVGDNYVDEVRYYMPIEKAWELYGSYYRSLDELEENKE